VNRSVLRPVWRLLLGWLLLLSSTGVEAQLSAEQALSASDWPGAVERAERALSAGGLPSAQWTALQRILGIARARLGEGDAARRAFICALALDPTLRLAPSETVEVRSPFMEARGFWSEHPAHLAASATLSDDQTALLVTLIDPAALVARVLVRARTAGQTQYVESSHAPSSSFPVPLEALTSGRSVELSLALIDENANRLWQLGSDAEPLQLSPTVVAARAAGASAGAATPVPNAQRMTSARPYYIGAALSLVVAAGAAALAGVSHAERERLAERWNAAKCAGEGDTRGEVCARESTQIKRAERMAWGFYALGAAGLIAGVVSLAAAPTQKQPDRAQRRAGRAFRCAAGPGLVGIGCSAAF
jgi:hypothetical protein